jgi:hypothetical protein
MKQTTLEKIFREILSLNIQIEQLTDRRNLLHNILMEDGMFESCAELDAAYIGWQEKNRNI